MTHDTLKNYIRMALLFFYRIFTSPQRGGGVIDNAKLVRALKNAP